MLPDALLAREVLDVTLSDGRTVRIPLCMTEFQHWNGPPLVFDFGGKPTVYHAGQAAWAQLRIASLFRDAGWDALVVQTYGGLHYLREMKRGHDDRGLALPESARDLFARIAEHNGGFGGFFDVFASRGDEVAFAEAKLSKKDRLSPTQRRWIAAALAAGVPNESLLIVEWKLSSAAPIALR
jgi:hypothetical protein